MNGIEKYEKFFDCNLKIKKLLRECAFDPRCSYSEETAFEFSKTLENKIEEIEYYMDYITTLFYNGRNDDLKNLINNCKQKLADCGSDWVKIKRFIEKYITDMRPELIELVGRNSYGYGGMGVSVRRAQTLNEALHIIHSSVVNCNRQYGNIPVLENKNNFEGYDIKLYGRENPIAKEIFDSIPFELSLGQTDILSLNNKILLMVRDRGHSLSIEVTVEGNKCFIQYYIPKICNVDMVNSLKGVDKVDKSSKFTTGRFEVDTIDIGASITDFISKVPMDTNMVFDFEYPIYQEESHKTL